MKKTNFFYAAAIALVSAFGMQSCSVEDNPSESIEPVKGPYVYDFAAVAEAGENPVKLNGNNANGQGFPWWESAEDPDRDRNGLRVISGKKVACCLRFAMYGCSITKLMVMSRMAVCR